MSAPSLLLLAAVLCIVARIAWIWWDSKRKPPGLFDSGWDLLIDNTERMKVMIGTVLMPTVERIIDALAEVKETT